MSSKKKFSIRFAGLHICFIFPTEIEIPKEFVPFLCEDDVLPDAEYEIQLLEEPLEITGQEVGSYNGIKVYPYKDGWLRDYTALTEKDGCQVACFLRKNKKNILYYPAAKWNYYAEEFRCLHLIGIEEILLWKEAILLHSSVVQIHGKTILFSGPSGVGKSTQASNWKEYVGAKILNGDRCIIRKIEDKFYGCGSPWAGTSGIYQSDMAEVKGIFILKKAEENSIRQVKTEAFLKIYEQSIVNAWDSRFVEKLSYLIAELLTQVPVYELCCQPNEEAVHLAYQTLFEGEI